MPPESRRRDIGHERVKPSAVMEYLLSTGHVIAGPPPPPVAKLLEKTHLCLREVEGSAVEQLIAPEVAQRNHARGVECLHAFGQMLGIPQCCVQGVLGEGSG